MLIAEVGAAAPFPLLPLEVASSAVFGSVTRPAPLPDVEPASTLRGAFEAVVLDALRAGPTFVSFSGGRDSSAVLAVATHLASVHGHPPPVPVTTRFPGSEAADEDAWQQLVLESLGVVEHVVIPVSTELDLLGDVASASLRRHGLLWPANAYMHDPLLAPCSGGTLLTGGGGDELLDASEASATNLVITRAARPGWRDVVRIVAAVGAGPAYDRRRARFVPRMPWLSSEGNTRFARAFVADEGRPHHPWSRSVRALADARSMAALRVGQDLLASGHGARIVHPFLDPGVLAAAAAQGGRLGLGGRSAAMRTLVGDLLPDALLTRRSKATFGDAVWGPAALAVARADETLDAVRADPQLAALVEIDRLRATWAQPEPHFMTACLLQAAFLARGLAGDGGAP